nr:unnamed protein product [Digitaria exilis]
MAPESSAIAKTRALWLGGPEPLSRLELSPDFWEEWKCGRAATPRTDALAAAALLLSSRGSSCSSAWLEQAPRKRRRGGPEEARWRRREELQQLAQWWRR